MIDVERLCFAYQTGGEELFGELDARFPTGALTVVTGESGRGKSTLLYLLGLMLTPERGQIAYSGHNVGTLPDRDRSAIRAGRVGFVFQDAALDQSRSVMDNVIEGALYAGVPRRVAQRRAQELLERFGVEIDHRRRPGEVSGEIGRASCRERV